MRSGLRGIMSRPMRAATLGLLLAGCGLATTAHAQVTSAWMYQGELKDSDAPANGLYDFQFRLFNAATGNTQVGPLVCGDDLAVQEGRFATPLDFGSVYTGGRLFLEIAVRADSGLSCGNPAGFVTIGPRQEVTIAPYAGYALGAASATTATNALGLNGQSATFYLQRSNHTGSLPTTALNGSYTAAVTMTNAANVFAGSFSGSGASLVGLNAGSISTGILGISRGGTGADTSGASNGQVLKFNGTTWAAGPDNDTTYAAGAGLALAGNAFSLAAQGATSGQVLKFNGSTWAPGSDVDTNTTYTAGGGLQLVGTVFSVPLGGITSTMILDDTLAAGDIAPNAITNSELASDSLSLSKVTGGGATMSASNMGIGVAPSASAKLNVGGNLVATGNASIGGTVSTDAVTLPATARVYSVPMIAFLAWDGTTTAGLVTVTDVEVSFSPTAGSDRTIYAPVNLPHGAVVTALHSHVEDASNTDLTVALVRRGLDGSAGSTMGSVLSSGNVAGTRIFSDTAISVATVDNNTYAYMVKVVFMPTIANPNPPILHGIRIAYTVTAPLP